MGPEHRSYSQLTTFEVCAHQWYLSKVEKVTEQPAVYLDAGSAVHSVIEQYNLALYKAGMQDV